MRRGRVAAAAAVAALLPLPTVAAQDVPLEDVGHVLGHPGAPITVVEFGDFACSACAVFHEATWPTIRREFVDTGRVLWRHVPFLLGFPRGREATRAAECAAQQGAYWEMHDALFDRQGEWTETGALDDVLQGYGEELGLHGGRFEECLDGDHGEERTKRANKAARDLAVRATPTFFIDGFRVQGALSVEAFRALLGSSSDPGPP